MLGKLGATEHYQHNSKEYLFGITVEVMVKVFFI
jgi:hypothetical protein